MGSRALVYYMSTTFIAVVIGIFMVLIVHPGDPRVKAQLGEVEKGKPVSTLDAFLDLIRSVFPDNLIAASFSTSKTMYIQAKAKRRISHLGDFLWQHNISRSLMLVDLLSLHNISSTSVNYDEFSYYTVDELHDNWQFLDVNQSNAFDELAWTQTYMRSKRKLQDEQYINMMGLIAFSITFGLVLTTMKEHARILIDFFTVLNDVLMKIVMIVVWYSPLGIMFLVAGKIVEVDDLEVVARALGLYVLTVVGGLILHATLVLPSIYYFITGKSPIVFLRGMLQAWALALATASSSATMPVTFRCLEENNGIDKRVTRFVIPKTVGATVNMDGTALYEAVGAIFIAQMNDRNLSFFEVVTTCLTATAASVGAASIPSAGLITLIVVLSAVGLPVEDVTLIYAVDWLLDRVRTSINVLGDAFGAAIVYHLSLSDLEEADAKLRLEDEQFVQRLRTGSVAIGGLQCSGSTYNLQQAVLRFGEELERNESTPTASPPGESPWHEVSPLAKPPPAPTSPQRLPNLNNGGHLQSGQRSHSQPQQLLVTMQPEQQQQRQSGNAPPPSDL